MSDHHRVSPGQHVKRPSASFRNELIDLLDQRRGGASGSGGTDDRITGSPAIVEIVNTSTTAVLPVGELIALGNATTSPPDETHAFKLLPRREASAASDTTPREQLAVVLASAAANRGVGLAAIVGQCVVRVVPNAEGDYNGEYLAASSTPGAAKFQAAKEGAFAIAQRPAEADRAAAFAGASNRFALAHFLAGSGSPTQLKFARSTGANQTQPTAATGRVGLVEAKPIADPAATPGSEVEPIVLAVVGRSGTSYSGGLDEPRFYLPAGSKVAYLESTAHEGAVGFVVSDHDEREQFNLYWGKVRDLQGAAETRDSGHFALPKQVRVKLLDRLTGADATTSPLVWVMVPAEHGFKPDDIICFRHQDGLRDGSIDNAVSDQNWGEDAWENGVFVALNVPGLDKDCPAYECGLAVGVKLPRAASTGVLRMFRGQRPNPNTPLSTTNRPPYELQLGHGTLGVLGNTGALGTSRWLLPGLPYGDWKLPSGPMWTDTAGNPMPAVNRSIRTRRHLVTRRITQNGNAVDYDYTAPGATGHLYLFGTFNGDADSNCTVNRIMLRVVDGLIQGGGISGGFTVANTNLPAWSRDFATTLPVSFDIDGDNATTEFDGGCCPKLDNATDVTQGP